ncbi:hypothetical protein F2Q69_00004584 [Brassica cretica]|uniref:Ubiquitin-like protease family profile domain-containing protein n=1 Tax=Brassica cretica TaxID=69181 RepID=A0A8S9NL46_BRACR|nr:hypothetical protein F2Q69_00004584 [Brassica cretica]
MLYPGYNPFAPIDKKMLKELVDWLKTCPHYRTLLDKKPRTSRTWWYQILQTSLEWLEDCHIDAWINVLRKRYDANPQYFRSERMCFLDHLFAQQWRFNYKEFKDSEPDHNGLGRRLPVTGTWVNTNPAVVSPAKKKVVKEDSPRPRKKARKEASEEAAVVASEEAAAEASEEVHTTVGGLTKEDIKTMFKDIVDAMREEFGMCLKEIKYLSERVEVVEKKVGITTKRKGTSAQNTTPPPKPTLEPGSQSVNGMNAGRKSLPEDKGPDVPADASSSKDKSPEPSLVLLDKNQSTVLDLQKEDARHLEKRDAALALFRAKSDRTRKLAASHHYRTPSIKNHGQVQLGGTTPSFCQSNKVWGTDIDDVYAPVNYNDTHWIAMWISIPKRHIVVWDSICSSISPEDLDVVMEPFLYMVPYLLVECASSDEQRAQYSLEPFTYERPTNIPPARAVTGTWVNTKLAVVSPAKKKVVKEDSPRPRKKARKEASEEAIEEAAAVASEEAAAEASEEVHTTVGGLTKEDIKTMFKDIVDAMREGFGTCLKEIKYLEMVEAVEKKVGITTKRKGTSAQNTTLPPKPTLEPASESVNGTNAGRKSLPEDKGPDVHADASSSKDKAPEPSLVLLDKNQSTVSDLQKEDARYLEKRDAALALCRAKSDRTRKLAASQQSPYTENSTAKVIILNKKLYPGYNPFAPIDKKKLKELADWLKTCPHYRTPLDKKPRKNDLPISRLHIDAWINVLRKRYDANPQHFRSERMCFLDHLFSQQWRFNYKDFKDSEPDQNGLGKRFPGGAWNYYAGTTPSFCQSNKVWGTDIDDVYAPVNYNDTHWIAMWISILKRHIVVWDNICSSISPEDLDVVMELFLYMVPYLLVECASSDEQRAQYSLEPFTYERPTNIPPARAGDCGVYTLKYIECHALGIEFSKKDFAKANGKSMRDKMAVDIFQELPDAHEFENKDMDDILGTYDG